MATRYRKERKVLKTQELMLPIPRVAGRGFVAPGAAERPPDGRPLSLAVAEAQGFGESLAYGLEDGLECSEDNRAAVGEDSGEACAEAFGFGVSFAVAEAVFFAIDFGNSFAVGERVGLQEPPRCQLASLTSLLVAAC